MKIYLVRPPGEPGLGGDREGNLPEAPQGLDWADGVIAIMDGADPDSGTSWECGYAYATRKPVVLFRSDLRRGGDLDDIPYNAMLIGAAGAHIELPLGTVDEAAAAIHAELVRLTPG